MNKSNFSFGYRNPGHWDVYTSDVRGRVFAIRGEPGCYFIRVEHDAFRKNREPGTFKTLDAAIAYVIAELTYEPQETKQ